MHKQWDLNSSHRLRYFTGNSQPKLLRKVAKWAERTGVEIFAINVEFGPFDDPVVVVAYFDKERGWLA